MFRAIPSQYQGAAFKVLRLAKSSAAPKPKTDGPGIGLSTTSGWFRGAPRITDHTRQLNQVRKMAANASKPDTAVNGVVANGATDVGIVETPRVPDPWTVDKALDTIAAGKPAEGSTSPVPYFHMLERLKTTKREGWKRFGIDRGESISDHMYRMSLMTMLCPSELATKLDMAKCMKMCLIHDMAEALVGDITPVDGVAKPEKSRREAETMDYITQRLLGKVEGGDVGKTIRDIWQEYEDSKTLESTFVHDIDKMELLLQMVEYEKRGQGKLDLGEFAYVKTKIVLQPVQNWAEELIQEREAFWSGHSHVRGDVGVDGGMPPEKRKMQDSYYKREGEDDKN
ncbi:HD domain-containing protein [Cercophora newfieldiana]|uniref:5'-deoxynucleotidase n=1 Tax=Cercophora newfieldiana TaxID=92897 RepID=A0AA39Y2M1_9PEZI|nr:HD domain-containing protein [Cercophora newfieldiana]